MREITFDQEALKKLQDGVNKMAKAVTVTLGPGGANVAMERQPGQSPHISKDGVTVSRDIFLDDPIENMGASVIREAANKTAELGGDGTTTSVLLAQAIFNEGVKQIAVGVNRIDLKKGIDIGVKRVVEELKKLATPVEGDDILKVATISANGDTDIAKLINEAIGQVGREGVVSVEDHQGVDSYVKRVEGMNFDRGYLSPYFVTNHEKQEVEFRNCEILIYDGVLDNIKMLTPFLDRIRKRGVTYPLLIIATDVTGDCLATLALNHLKQNISVCCVQSPSPIGDVKKEDLRDFAVVTGAKIITKETGLTLKTADADVLGKADRVKVTNWRTTIIGGHGDPDEIIDRVKSIKSQMEDTNEQAKVSLKDRLARLVSGIAVIYVGGTTQVEIKEKKDRIDDALQSTRAALDEGIIIGGGIGYLLTWSKYTPTPTDMNRDQFIGSKIVWDVLLTPIKTIAENCGVNGDVVVNNVLTNSGGIDNFGFNAKTQNYENLIAAGIIDPFKVTRLALENAGSVAGMLLTTKAVIFNAKPKTV